MAAKAGEDSAPFFSRPEEYFNVDHTNGSTFFSFFNELLQKNYVHDVNIICQNEEFLAHKSILMSNSSYFQGLWAKAKPESVRKVEISADPGILKKVLQYLYTGKLSVSVSSLPELSQTAQLLGVERLVHESKRCSFLNVVPSVDNCLEVWSVGELTKDEKLVKIAKPLVLAHLSELVDSPAFYALPLPCLIKCLSDLSISIQNPQDKFVCALEWVSHDSSRDQDLCEILKSLPLNKMGKSFLKQSLHNPVLANNQAAKYIVNEAVEATKSFKVTKSPVASAASSSSHNIAAVGMESRVNNQLGRPSTDNTPVPISPKGQVTAPVEATKSFKVTKSPVASAARSSSKYIATVGIKSRVNNQWSRPCTDIKLLPVSRKGQVTSLTELPSPVRRDGQACVAAGNALLVSALNRSCNEIWKFDLVSKEWKMLCKLHNSRHSHAMTEVKGNIVIAGGVHPKTGRFIGFVEMLFQNKTSCVQTGVIRGSDDGETLCHKIKETDVAIVASSSDKVQIYSTVTHRTICCALPPGSTSYMFGLVLVKNELIMFSGSGTYICPLDALYLGQSYAVYMLKKFMTPNKWCGVVVDDGEGMVMLVGGYNRDNVDDDADCLYRATVRDLINDRKGWEVRRSTSELSKTLVLSSSCCLLNVPERR